MRAVSDDLQTTFRYDVTVLITLFYSDTVEVFKYAMLQLFNVTFNSISVISGCKCHWWL